MDCYGRVGSAVQDKKPSPSHQPSGEKHRKRWALTPHRDLLSCTHRTRSLLADVPTKHEQAMSHAENITLAVHCPSQQPENSCLRHDKVSYEVDEQKRLLRLFQLLSKAWRGLTRGRWMEHTSPFAWQALCLTAAQHGERLGLLVLIKPAPCSQLEVVYEEAELCNCLPVR